MGGDAAGGRELLFEAPWVMTFPGLAIFIVVAAINLFGDGLRDALDPKTGTIKCDSMNRMSAKILGCLLLALCLSGCATLRPTGKSVEKEEQREACSISIRAKVFESQETLRRRLLLSNAADLDPSSCFAQRI